jgi:hypothetical protein
MLLPFMIYPLDQLKPKTKTKNQNIFCLCKWNFDDYLNIGDKKIEG